MQIVILILSTLNFIGLLTAAIIYFRKNYVICSKEIYDLVMDYYLDNHDEEGNELNRELAGGVGCEAGFFREALYEEEGEPDEEEE